MQLIVFAVIATLSLGACDEYHTSGNSNGYFGGGGRGAHIPIVHYENINNGDGSYRYSYETGNGISVNEKGAPNAPGPEGPAVTAQGGFSYTGPDGIRYSITYTADENGFHAVGAHIPTPPPIPEAILRSLSGAGYNDQGSHYHSGAGYVPSKRPYQY
ncbi:hypothetical protein RI129_010884 [Pyrocoelia pectoralis]|uniref:Uncharacterized protein n=1 Tax=Pyrocoelia pectoralis TaxID=417401 RepID=A0AAN7ZIB4_9COLE